MKKKKRKVYCTRYSQAVTHPSTDRARRCLTAVIGREPVFSTWYGRRHFTATIERLYARSPHKGRSSPLSSAFACAPYMYFGTYVYVPFSWHWKRNEVLPGSCSHVPYMKSHVATYRLLVVLHTAQSLVHVILYLTPTSRYQTSIHYTCKTISTNYRSRQIFEYYAEQDRPD